MKKTTSKFIAISVCIAMLASMLAACNTGGGGGNGGGTFTPPEDEDPYVTELSVVTPPTKTDYKAGQLFDAAGMKLLAKWSHGEEEDIFPSECKKSPTGPLEAGTTAITFTYEGASCSQAITVTNRSLETVTFDSSAVKENQVAGAIDLTVIKVEAFYDDETSETITAGQYVLTENGQVISNPNAYVISPGRHTVKVEFGGFSDEFSFFAALDAFDVPITVYGADDLDRLIASKSSFLYKPDPSYSYSHGGVENGESIIYNIYGGSVMRFYIYMEEQTDVELKVRAASAQVLANSWGDVRKTGEQRFNKVFDVSKVKVDRETNAPELDGEDNEIKTAIPIEDYVILPGGSSETNDPALKGNFVNLSLGETALEAGYNIIEFKCISEYADVNGAMRGCQFAKLTVQTAFTVEHEHTPVKTDATAPDCIHYGTEEYYTCGICGRMYADGECKERLLAHKYVRPDEVHTPDIPQATCAAEQKCAVCGKILAEKVSHTFEHDLCDYDGEAECTVCHTKVPAGHTLTESKTQTGTYAAAGRPIYLTENKCSRCDKVFGVKIQAEDKTLVKYYKHDGTEFTDSVSLSHATEIADGAVFNGAETAALTNFNSDNGNINGNWSAPLDTNGPIIKIKVNVSEAGQYAFFTRCHSYASVGAGGSMTAQDLSGVLKYCVNPSDDNAEYVAVSGKAAPGNVKNDTVTENWDRKQSYRWAVTKLADIALDAGENTVALRVTDWYCCDIDWFSFERTDKIAHYDAEVVSARSDGTNYNASSTAGGMIADGIMLETYLRIKLPEEKASEYGWAYEDVLITEDMIKEAMTKAGRGDNALDIIKDSGNYSLTFTVEKYGKTYSATFDYTVV